MVKFFESYCETHEMKIESLKNSHYSKLWRCIESLFCFALPIATIVRECCSNGPLEPEVEELKCGISSNES